MTTRKLKPWPRCDAPLCEREADLSVHAEGDNCYFHGHLCSEHGEMFRAVFPAMRLTMALMRVITREALHAAMKADAMSRP